MDNKNSKMFKMWAMLFVELKAFLKTFLKTF